MRYLLKHRRKNIQIKWDTHTDDLPVGGKKRRILVYNYRSLTLWFLTLVAITCKHMQLTTTQISTKQKTIFCILLPWFQTLFNIFQPSTTLKHLAYPKLTGTLNEFNKKIKRHVFMVQLNQWTGKCRARTSVRAWTSRFLWWKMKTGSS